MSKTETLLIESNLAKKWDDTTTHTVGQTAAIIESYIRDQKWIPKT